jgi:HlyD family secretion protein
VEAALQRTQVNLRYAIITSPIDGIVISRNVDVGQTVAASLQAPTLFTIAQDLAQMQIETDIDEADIGRLEEGMEATFTVDSYPDETFHGKIHQIRYAAKTDQNVVTYPVILLVENPDLKLRPGMTANVSVVIARKEDVLCVPAAALRFRPADYKPESGNGVGEAARRDSARGDSTRGGRRHHGGDSTRTAGHEGTQKFKPPTVVFTKDSKGQAVPRPVTAGLNDGSHAEIMSGELSIGDSVIVGLAGTNSGQRSTLPPGMGGGPPRR